MKLKSPQNIFPLLHSTGNRLTYDYSLIHRSDLGIFKHIQDPNMPVSGHR